MKKTVFIVFFCISILYSFCQKDYTTSFSQPSPGVYEISFHINHWDLGVETYDNITYQKLIFSASTTTQEKGWAELPFISASLQLPDDKNVTIVIKDIQYQYDTLTSPLLPSRGTIYRNQDPNSIAYSIAPESMVNSYYPTDNVTMEEPYIVRDVRGTSVRFYPFQYNALNQTLRIATQVTIQLVENDSPATNPLTHANPHPLKDAIGIYKSMFLNYQPTRDALAHGEMGDILVITTSSYESAIEPYIQWKKEMGYKVSKQVVSSGTNVVNLIKNEYLANNNLLYVQLVGDWADIKSNADVDNSPTDPKMGCVAGNDNYPDIAIGRFSCNTAAQLTAQVNKTINYEKNPDMSAGWRETFIGIGSSEGPGDDNEIDYTHIQRIYSERLSGFGYNTHLQNYEPNATATTLLQHINQGASVIAYCGHGDVTLFGTTEFSNSHISQLANDAKLPFIVSVACLNGAFHKSYDCFAETWLRKENGGAVVTLMSSISQPWEPPQRGQDYFFDILTGGFNYNTYAGQSGINTSEQRTRWGSIVINSYNLMLSESSTTDDQETIQTWGTFGDASLQLRTQQPVAITSSNMNLTAGVPFITTITSNGTPVANALVCISQNDSYFSALTDANGNVSIPHTFISGDILLVVTAFNTTTIYETISCTQSNTPYLIVDSYTPSYVAVDHNNFLTLTIKNLGGVATTNNTRITLSCNDPLLSFVDATEECSIIAAMGGTATCTYGFQTIVASTVETGHTFTVDVTMTCGNYIWNGVLYLTALGNNCETPVGIEVTAGSTFATVTWEDNSTIEDITITDDAEEHTAFAINSAGNVGWTYIDGDGENTGSFRTLSFTNEGSPMAYIIMNTEQTEGIGSVTAHSGTQFWGCPYATSSNWYSSVTNDDWLISPQLNFTEEYTFAFYARSFSTSYSAEKFYIEYSTTGNGTSDFTKLSNTAVTTSTTWNEYSYTIPAEAKYVAIHCVSDNQYMLCIDDITLTGRAIDGYTYNVYRNDELIAENVIGGNFIDENVPDGNYCYTVTAKCPHQYESLPTEYSCAAVSVDSYETNNRNINIYPNPASQTLTIEGNSLQGINIYNIAGQLITSISNSNSHTTIDVSNFAEGLYFVKIINNNKTIDIKKVIIEH